MVLTKRKLILGALALLLGVFLYRVFAIYTVRSGECRPRPVDPGLRRLTRDEHGTLVSFPERTDFPPQRRPLVVMTYNIAGHDELADGDHVRHVADAIRRIRPDIVVLQEVHRKTWQVRFRDQLAELKSRTGLNAYFAPSFVLWGGGYGNAILTRGQIVHAEAHPLPCIGEPRALLEATIRIDQATISVYATHLTSWGRLNSGIWNGANRSWRKWLPWAPARPSGRSTGSEHVTLLPSVRPGIRRNSPSVDFPSGGWNLGQPFSPDDREGVEEPAPVQADC